MHLKIQDKKQSKKKRGQSYNPKPASW